MRIKDCNLFAEYPMVYCRCGHTNDGIHYSIVRLRGRLFKVKEVVNEWLDQTIQGVIKKRYCVITSDNLTCLISYDMLAKNWYFDQVED